MADERKKSEGGGPPPAGAGSPPGGAYEVLRARLTEQCAELRGRVDRLNARRKEVFGGQEMALAGTSRIQTENNCVPRDIIHIGRKLLFGYDVFLGMKREIEVADVLSVYAFDGKDFQGLGPDFLADPAFVKDFKELFRYYKGARLLQLRNTGTHLLLIFQAGASHTDFKVFQWIISQDHSVRYADNRGEREHCYPPQYDFEWKRSTREMHVPGKHPHLNIEDRVFVETVGGDLTIKVENNTESGLGVYSEPVDDPNQALGDAEIQYALLGNLVLLKIKPFAEQRYRHIIFSRLTEKAVRVDAVGQACVQLPEGHGVLFPGGYFLQTGECKTFDEQIDGMEFFKAIRSPNGEDVLYLFHHRKDGRYFLLKYNLIEKEVATPLSCHGYSLFEDGKLVLFKTTTNEPAKSHAVQIWDTPFWSDDFARPLGSDSFLAKVGNKDLVRGISDAITVTRLARESTASTVAYQDLVRHTERVLDSYHWLEHQECLGLGGVLRQIRETGNTIIDEFEKVLSIRRGTAEQIGRFEDEVTQLFNRIRLEAPQTIDQFAAALARLRQTRGRLITLQELRYADHQRLKALEERLVQKSDELSKQTVGFLLTPGALEPYTLKLRELDQGIEALAKVAEAEAPRLQVDELAGGLDLLAEIINNLKIDDSTQRTGILEALTDVYAHINRTRARLEGRRKDLLGGERVAEFAAQFKLLSQGVSGCLALCDSPDKCDEQLTRLLVQVEELEAKFSDFPEYLEKIGTKRDEIYDAFSTRKQQLLDERQRKANALFDAATRILAGVVRRAASFKGPDELNAYFAADPMVLKIRDLAEKLRELGDSVKADDIQSRLKTARQDAGRGLRDKQELFEEGAEIIRLGHKRFSVNTQPLEMSLVLRGGEMQFHLTGTDYYQPVQDEAFLKTSALWSREIVSESPSVYRAEYLAYCILDEAQSGGKGLSLERLRNSASSEAELQKLIREYATERYDEGYERGVHDHDAGRILSAALALQLQAGLLRFDPSHRAVACIFWGWFADPAARALLQRKAQSLGRMGQLFQRDGPSAVLHRQLVDLLRGFFEAAGIPLAGLDLDLSAQYLFQELAQAHPQGFVTSAEAQQLHQAFLASLDEKHARRGLEGDLEALQADLQNSFDLARSWLDGFLAGRSGSGASHFALEVLGIVLTRNRLPRATLHAQIGTRVEGLLGQHPCLQGGVLELRLDEFLKRLKSFASEDVPAFRAYQEQRKALVQRERERLRLSEYKAKTLSSFVRNRLINEVYLPAIGENLAKQIGEVGEKKRTDLMGLLLLISPPGYGKTTLMEYVADRLGLVFMKINGPALGNEVHSLDPAAAPNATSREEVEKLNLALEMGNNVMLYVDDIQHVDPEFLQKFISLCDAQRKIEGVWGGKTKTYDFRGKKVCVVMAGNPYTESGARFRIPDMLANRADTYNLGDIIGGRQDLFELSYLENCLTSNPALSTLATREQADFYKLVETADGGQTPDAELTHDYSAAELKDMVEVIRKLRKIQRVVLKVNQAYIHSAGQNDDYRTEPPFKLQGSYRNMNKMAAKVLPVTSDSELDQLVFDHYNSEAQTLTSGAEMNLLKLAEIRGLFSDSQRERWEEIKRTFNRKQVLFGEGADDKVSLVVSQLAAFNDGLDRIKSVLAKAAESRQAEELGTRLASQLSASLAEVGTAFSRAEESRVAEGRALSGRLEASLQGLGERLSASASVGPQLGERLEEALQRVAGQLGSAGAAGAETREALFAEKIAEALARLGQTLAAAGAGRPGAAPQTLPPKIEIVNTLPKYYGNLYKHHIDVIEAVLVPLVKGLNEQIKNTDQVHGLLLKVVEHLNQQASKHTGLKVRATGKIPPPPPPPSNPSA